MNEISGNVEDLRRLGNNALPGIGNCFAEASKVLDDLGGFDRVLEHDDIDDADLKSAWVAMRTAIQQLTAANATSLHATGVAVNKAADAFIERDGLNAQEIGENIPTVEPVEPESP